MYLIFLIFFSYFLNNEVKIQLILSISEAVNNAKLIEKIINVTKIVNISKMLKLSWKPLIKMNIPTTEKIANVIFRSFFIPYNICNIKLLTFIIFMLPAKYAVWIL